MNPLRKSYLSNYFQQRSDQTVKRIIGTVAILILAATLVSCEWIRGRGKKEDAAAKRVEVVRSGDFQKLISATGNLEALIDVEVKANVAGEIIDLYVDDGDYVEKDQVLLEIDPEQYVEEKKQAEADVDAAQAQLRQSQLNIILKTEELESARQQAEDSVKIAQSNLKTTEAASQTQITSAETDIQTTRNQLDQDNIALEQAKIELNRANIRLAELDTELESVKVERDNALSERNRNKELFEKKLVSKKSLEEAESRYANAESQYKTALKRKESQEETVNSQLKTIATRQSAIANRNLTQTYQKMNLEELRKMREAEEEEKRLQLQISKTRLAEILETIDNEKIVTEQGAVSAQANLLRRRSSLKNQEEQLEWTTIKAPMAGTVTLLEIEEGEIVTSGRSAFSQSPPLMTIADLSKMVVKTYINEVDMERLRMDQQANIKVDAYKDKIYEGRVAEISPSGEERDNIITFEVMVEVVGSPSELRPGMSADVDVVTYEEKDVLMLPIDAVQDETSAIATAQVGADADAFKTDQEVELKTLTGKSFIGKVTSISGDRLTISLDSSQRGLRDGERTFTLLVNGKQKADGVSTNIKITKDKFVMLDAQGGSEKGNGNSKGQKGKRVSIEAGEQNETDVIIKSGLVDGDRVILPERKGAPGGPGRPS
ncbi:HlyD family efflux transporter periplasmic adaptor subunit [Candidatus Poribacteria bacterium]|nr:HlyD family efflux transporter periplasmic adaptor subunit [Candidatus Poribacteria bacterium]